MRSCFSHRNFLWSYVASGVMSILLCCTVAHSDVQFSHDGGLFTEDFELELTGDVPGAAIHYTLDGSVPSESSPVYTAPIEISASTQVRALAFAPDSAPGTLVSQSYLKLDADLDSFSSNLPIVVVDSFGYDINSESGWEGYRPIYPFRPVYAVFIETAESGRATISDVPDFEGRAGMKVRGNSSQILPKKQYAFETWDEYDEDKDVSLLGFPSESDWVFHAPYGDKALMRNYLAYKWGNEIGRYTVRRRHVEMFFNWNDGIVGMDDYAGVYVFMEKIKRGANRVDITRLEPTDNTEPAITGGYIIALDALDEDERETAWQTSHGIPDGYPWNGFIYVYPDQEDITEAQSAWIKGYLEDFEGALYGPDFANPETGYANYIDDDSFRDYLLMTEALKNADSYYASVFMHKDRGGKLTMGPIWDWNVSMGSTSDHNCWDPSGLLYEWVGAFWLDRLRDDPEFQLRFADRWFDLRERVLAIDRLLADIDATAASLDEAQQRNFTRWPILGEYISELPHLNPVGWEERDTYQKEVDWMKDWLSTRLDWLDGTVAEEFGTTPPIFYVAGALLDTGGHVEIGDSLTMGLPDGATGTIYYTLDGSDPRVPGTPPGVAGTAIEYAGAITLTDTTHVKARIRDGDVWSALNRATFYTRDLRDALRVTEIMYHPAGGGAEFIELHNVGSNPEDISGVYFSEGIEFTFPANTILQPGEYVVLVSSEDESDFASQYPGVAIGGLYELRLSNGGEAVEVSDANGGVLISFTYDDDAPWPIETDGLGYSLVRVDLEGDPNDPASWSASRQVGGSPGEPESDVTAAFTANPASGNRPLTVAFTDESAGPVTSWSWDFGDGTASTEQNPSHTYYLAGDHTVTLSVSSPNGFDTETGVIHADEEVSVEADRYKTIVDDIKVTYNRGGCLAWHNELDDTLRIEVLEDGGTLNLTAGEEAATYWDSRCDVYIYAPDASIKKINLKGRPETQLYVCGQVGYVKNFVLKYGHVGDTLSYGPEVGLGSAALDPPKKILIKAGWSTAPVLGIGYPELRFNPEGAEDEVGTVELKPKPFDILLDEEDAGAEASSVETKAAYSFERGDIKVLYSKPGCEAEYNSDDDILMIRISESDGDLTVKFGEDVYYYWDDYCDIYIDAPDASINRMILKGRPETTLYVCGEVASVNNFKLKHGSVGDTGHYGPDFGLVNTSLALPSKIKILWGWATAPVLGVYEE